MSKTYRIHGTRYLRKYTADERSSIYAYMSDVRKIANSLCNVPWERVSRDIAATTTIHTEEGIDWNAPERERFDAAEWCGEHSDGFHRAFAQAACYVFALPDSAVGTSVEKLGIQVTSDPYNPYGARISAMTSATLDIPMDCATVRTGEVYRAPDEDGMGAAPRLFMRNADGSQTWYANTEKVELVPDTPLTAKKYLFVFCCLENYNRGRDGWIEGSSYIDNDVELTLSAAASGLSYDELNDLTPPVVLSEFNVCRGGVLPPLEGNVSGVQAVGVALDGGVEIDGDGMTNAVDETSSIGLRTAYGKFYKGLADQLLADEYGLLSGVRPGAAFSVSARPLDGDIENLGLLSWKQSETMTSGFNDIAYGNGVLVAGGYNSGIWRSTDFGRTWVKNDQFPTLDVNCVAYGNGKFVTVIGNSTFYSDDCGITWTKVENNITNGLHNGIVYGNGVFVVAGDYGIKYSTDYGMTWINSNKTGVYVTKPAYGNGVFVAGGNNIGLWYSTDYGVTWTQSAVSTGWYSAIGYGNGRFVAIRIDEQARVKISSDGRTWSDGSSNNIRFNGKIAFGDGIFVCSDTYYGIHFSTDSGATWQASSQRTGRFNGIVYCESNRSFVCGGNADSRGVLYSGIIRSWVNWKVMSSVLFVRTSVPLDFRASKVRLDWENWSGNATSGSKFNVWMKRGSFAAEYDADAIKNHVIYDAESDTAGDYELVGTIDATLASRTATLNLKSPLTGEVATFLLSAYVSMDHVNPSRSMQLPVGAAASQYVDQVHKRVVNVSTGWRPDITLLG